MKLSGDYGKAGLCGRVRAWDGRAGSVFRGFGLKAREVRGAQNIHRRRAGRKQLFDDHNRFRPAPRTAAAGIVRPLAGVLASIMPFGNIGKVLASQALEATKKNVIDAITGSETPKAGEKPAAAPAAETVGGTILGQLQAMQRQLKDDQELVVMFHAGAEALRVTEIFVPNLQVFVLAGTDADHNVTRIVTPADRAQFICRIRKVAPEARPVRVNVLSARPKPESPSAG